MNASAMLLAMGILGVDFGWQPDKQGRLEYIIQIEPQLLAALRDGEEIISAIVPEVQGVRRFRIRVGTGQLPRHSPTRWKTAAPVRTVTAPRKLVIHKTVAAPDQSRFKEVELVNREVAVAKPDRPSPPRSNPLLSIFRQRSVPRRRGLKIASEQQPEAPQKLSMLKPTLGPNEQGGAEQQEAKSSQGYWLFLALVGSVGLNGFLGWMWISFYHKYRSLLAR